MGAEKGMEMGLLVTLIAAVTTMMLWVGGAAQSSGCTNVIVSMAPCLNYITGSSSNPSSSCCQQLASVVQSQPQCLCKVLNGGSSVTAALGISINQTLALALPGACNVKTRPVSACNVVNGPSSSPATESPVGSPISSSTVPKESSDGNTDSTTTTPVSNTPSGIGSKAEPSTGMDTSEGTRIITKSPLHLVVLVLFIMLASFASTLTSL
ncbi:non-specific lipid transfer protein GPI-anchored 5-like [Telopea speciosissima]|uniref:non-specific lipid transfer protein GPI-anchored 5-like n=1 Tax=Telopea speciosissima TaxID=54955 RepID=UPI001CC4E934|nr:non-specific lipid transfer protein GPI-anchored 5-like [Telopea speciosissima]